MKLFAFLLFFLILTLTSSSERVNVRELLRKVWLEVEVRMSNEYRLLPGRILSQKVTPFDGVMVNVSFEIRQTNCLTATPSQQTCDMRPIRVMPGYANATIFNGTRGTFLGRFEFTRLEKIH